MRKRYNFSKRLEELSVRKEALTNELEKIRLIENDLNSELFKFQQEKCVEEYNAIDKILFDFEKVSERDIIIALSKRKSIINFMAIKDHIKMKDKFAEELKDVNERIREYRDKQSKLG